MTEVSAWTNPVSVVARELSYEEVADLDRLRAVLASAVDRTEARAVSWLWDSMVAAHGGRQAPAGFVEAVATAIGDLLAVHVPGVRWSVWPGPSGPTLGVSSDARPHAPVVPFLDTQDRWDARRQDWIVDYLARAATHLAGTGVPQPRHAPDDVAPAPVTPGVAVPGVAVPDELAIPGLVPDEPDGLVTPSLEPDEPAAPADPQPTWGTDATPEPTSFVVPDPVPAPEPQPAYQPEPAAEIALVAEPVAPAAEPTPVPPLEPAAAEPTAVDPTPAPAPALGAPAYVPDMPLEDFALDALDHAMSLLRETGAFDREVFVMMLDGSGRRTESCPGDAAEARFRARELVRSSGAARAAVTWIERDPADLPGPRQAFPAVVVDAWDAGCEGIRVGRRFVDDVLGTGPLGGRLVVGPIAPLL